MFDQMSRSRTFLPSTSVRPWNTPRPFANAPYEGSCIVPSLLPSNCSLHCPDFGLYRKSVRPWKWPPEPEASIFSMLARPFHRGWSITLPVNSVHAPAPEAVTSRLWMCVCHVPKWKSKACCWSAPCTVPAADDDGHAVVITRASRQVRKIVVVYMRFVLPYGIRIDINGRS